MNTNFLKKLDSNTLNLIANAQFDDLVERRGIKDPEMFRRCMMRAVAEDLDMAVYVETFSDIAGVAFVEYHELRAAEAAAAVQPADDDTEASDNAPDADDVEDDNE